MAQVILSKTIKIHTSNLLALRETNTALIRRLQTLQDRAKTILYIPFKPIYKIRGQKDQHPSIKVISALTSNLPGKTTPIPIIIKYYISSLAILTLDIINQGCYSLAYLTV